MVMYLASGIANEADQGLALGSLVGQHLGGDLNEE